MPSLNWSPLDTSTDQDHVIAHVIGTSVVAYFTMPGVMHLLLDIGFIWTIYADGDMALLPQSTAISEMEAEETTRRELLAEARLLYDSGREASGLRAFAPLPVDCLITEVEYQGVDDRRRVLVKCEEGNLLIDSSPTKGEMSVNVDAGGLEEAAAGEREYLREKLRQDLGRVPTEEELDEWLREHTEGY
jgi:hypothetical protein